MSVIVGSDIFSNTWGTVYNIISGNVTDPSSRGGSQWIFSDYPQIQEGKTDEHPGYPLITIEPFQADSSNIVFRHGKSYTELTSVISVHTRTKRHVDVVSSDIWDALNSKQSVLYQSGLSHLMVSPGGVETYAPDRYNKVHTKNMGVRMMVGI